MHPCVASCSTAGSPSTQGLGSSQEAPPAPPSLVHLGVRLDEDAVSGFFQDAKCHAAPESRPQSLLQENGAQPHHQICVISPAEGRSAQEGGEIGPGQGRAPCPAGKNFMFQKTLSHCPSCSAQLPGDSHPHSALMGFLRGQ